MRPIQGIPPITSVCMSGRAYVAAGAVSYSQLNSDSSYRSWVWRVHEGVLTDTLPNAGIEAPTQRHHIKDIETSVQAQSYYTGGETPVHAETQHTGSMSIQRVKHTETRLCCHVLLL